MREDNTEQQLIRLIESKMKEFDTHFVESLLKGVKAKFRSIDENGFYAYLNNFFLLRNI